MHRDFKPDNVLVGRDGRVEVADFGLVRGSRDDTQSIGPSPVDTGDLAAIDLLSSQVTRVGTLLGTPAHMAPEQLFTSGGDARSDQFSFCVSLWETLHGHRPFRASNAAELAGALMNGDPDQGANPNRVPSWLHRVLARGLRPDAAERWPDMRTLVAELERGRSRGRRRLKLAALGLVEQTRAESDHANTVACLEQHHGAFSSFVERLGRPDREAVLSALTATDDLPSLSTCTDDLALRGWPQPPADVPPERIDAVRHGLDIARAELTIGRIEDAQVRFAEASRLAAEIGWSPLLARARTDQGAAMTLTHEAAAAQAVLVDGFMLALAAGDDDTAIDAAIELGDLATDRLQQPEQGRLWIRQAQSLIERRGGDTSARSAQAAAHTRLDRGQARAL